MHMLERGELFSKQAGELFSLCWSPSSTICPCGDPPFERNYGFAAVGMLSNVLKKWRLLQLPESENHRGVTEEDSYVGDSEESAYG